MTRQLVATRITGLPDTSAWTAGLDATGGALCIASGYWDATAFERARAVADEVGAPHVRMLLWVAGSTKAGWRAARAAAAADGSLDLRFLDSPEGGGIFHVKVTAIADDADAWIRAYVGSANWTAAAHARNLELGVAIDHGDPSLEVLAAWFDDACAAATTAAEIDWDLAIETAAERSEAAARREAFVAARIAAPVPAAPARAR